MIITSLAALIVVPNVANILVEITSKKNQETNRKYESKRCITRQIQYTDFGQHNRRNQREKGSKETRKGNVTDRRYIEFNLTTKVPQKLLILDFMFFFAHCFVCSVSTNHRTENGQKMDTYGYNTFQVPPPHVSTWSTCRND